MYDADQHPLSAFRQWLESRRLSPRTIQAYSCAAEQFLGRYLSVTPEALRLYKCFLLERYKPRTVNLRIRAINCYLEFLGMREQRLSMLRIQQQTFLEHIISQADYEYLKQCLLRDGNRLYYFIIRYMAATGVRVSELVLLTVSDARRGYADITSKGSRTRRIYIPAGLQADTLSWLEESGRNKGALFPGSRGEPVTPAAIRGQLRKFHVLYGLDPRVMHPHAFRHRFAKNFIDACGDLSFLSDLLGHQSIETTRIYLHRTAAEQQALVNRIVNW